jgi:alpha-ketoglutarate-dependent taurine dioxygenase
MGKLAEYMIPESVSKEYIRFVQGIQHDPYKHHVALANILAEKLRELLPKEVARSLIDMANGGETQAVIIKGMPIDPVIPQSGSLKEKMAEKSRVSEMSILGITSLMNCYLASDPNEQGGRIVHNIHPVKNAKKGPSSKSTDPFYLHIENPFLQRPPHFLMLLGLSPDPTAKTTLFMAGNVTAHLPEWVINAAKKEQFEIRSGAGFDDVVKGTYALISTDKETNRFQLRLYESPERIKPLNAEAKCALDFIINKFAKVAPSNTMAVSIQPGEAVIFNNGYNLRHDEGMMHGRAGIISSPERWLQRGFLYQRTNDWREAFAQEEYSLLCRVINSKSYPLKDAAKLLAAAMLGSRDYKEYQQQNPGTSVSKTLLYGTKKSEIPATSWLGRVVTEYEETKDIKDTKDTCIRAKL